MKRQFIFLCILLSVCVAANSPKPTLPVPPNRNDLLGDWIGFDVEAGFYYRLVLKPEGGHFAYVFSDYPPRSYNVAAWSLKESTIDINLTNVSAAAKTMHVLGRASSYDLDVKIEGDDGNWTQKVVLFREENILSKVKQLQKATASEPREPTKPPKVKGA